jgi:hypothetical protein
MVYSLARIGAALGMKVEGAYTERHRLWVRLREKGGKAHAMPCHHSLEECLRAYIASCSLAEDPKGPLFRTIGRGTGRLTRNAITQGDAYAMIGRRAIAAGIAKKIGNNTFRATGITVYVKNGGTLENAAAMANHARTRTTQLYDRGRDDVTFEVERIHIRITASCLKNINDSPYIRLPFVSAKSVCCPAFANARRRKNFCSTGMCAGGSDPARWKDCCASGDT